MRTGWHDAAYQLALGIPLASQFPNQVDAWQGGRPTKEGLGTRRARVIQRIPAHRSAAHRHRRKAVLENFKSPLFQIGLNRTFGRCWDTVRAPMLLLYLRKVYQVLGKTNRGRSVSYLMLVEFGWPRPEGHRQIIPKLGNWLARRFPILGIFF